MKRFCILAVLVIAGCATPEQRAQQVIAAYGPYCEKLGYTPNSDPWRQCLQTEDMRDAMALQRSHDMMFMPGFGCLHATRSPFC